MTTWRTLYHLTRADFLERARRYSFLITIGLTIYLAYLSLPPLEASYLTFGMGNCRGVYNSAWVGSAVAALCSTALTLPGFYLVKNTIGRDRDTGVGQIIATTPLSKWIYTLGKMFSNCVFLTVMVGVIMMAAIVMQLVRAEVLRIELWPFFAPFLFTTLPMMALIAALAVLFETIGWLRGGAGNVVYFFLYVTLLVSSIVPALDGSGASEYKVFNDPMGVTAIVSGMTSAAREQYPDYDGSFSIGEAPVEGPIETFVWNGVRWTPKIIMGRLPWMGVAMGLVFIASSFFHRFDPARERWRRMQSKRVVPAEVKAPSPPTMTPTSTHLTPLERQKAHGMSLFGRTLLAELRLTLKGLPWWWYVVAMGLIVASLFTPIDVARQHLLPLAWIWPILLWSALGNRELRHRTNQLVFSAAHPLPRQLPATWLAGLTIALIMGSGLAMRLVLGGHWDVLFAWSVGAAFIPSLALALGIWSGSSKLFEVVYVVLWYAGPMNRVPFLDYMGVTGEIIATGVPLYYLGLVVLLLGLAVVGRWRQIQV